MDDLERTAEVQQDLDILLKGGKRMVRGNRIREIRKQHGMTLTDLAGKIGVSIPYLSDIERGNRRGSEKIISQIADVLEVRVEELNKAG